MVSYVDHMTPPAVEMGFVVTIGGRAIDLLDVCARDPALVLLAGRGARA